MAISQNVDRLPDPGFISGAPGANTVSLEADSPIGFSYTNAGVGKARALTAHRWKFRLTYPPMIEQEFNLFYPFILKLQGRLTLFDVCLPNYYMPKDGWVSEDITISANAQIGSSTISTSGWKDYSVDQNGPELKIGDVIQFPETSTKVYVVTGVSATGTTRNINIVPNLVAPCAAGEEVRVNNVLFRVRLSSDTIDYSLALNRLYSTSLSVEESIEYS